MKINWNHIEGIGFSMILVLSMLHNINTSSFPSPSSKNIVCFTRQCEKSANNLLSSMNLHADPCVDFYEYACGNYGKTHPISPGWYQMDRFREVQLEITREVQDYLKEYGNYDEPLAVHKARALYATCMDTNTMNNLSIAPIEMILEDIQLPLKPPFDDNFINNFNWITVAANLKLTLGLDFLFNVLVEHDLQNYSVNIVHISKERVKGLFPIFIDENSEEWGPNFVQSEQLLFTNGKDEGISMKYAHPFLVYVKSIIRIVYQYSKSSIPDNIRAQLDNDILELYKFAYMREKIVRKIRKNEETRKKMTISELQRKTKKITDKKKQNLSVDWIELLNAIFKDINGISYQFDEGDSILVSNWEYTKDILSFLADSDPKIVAMALWLDSITTLAVNSTNKLRNSYYKYRSDVLGENQFVSRDNYCTGVVINIMGFAIAHKYLNNPDVYVNKYKINLMTGIMLYVFKNTIENLNWMDDYTKWAALEKLDGMKRNIGFPSWLRNTNALNIYYQDVKVYRGYFLFSITSYRQIMIDANIARLSGINDQNNKSAFVMSPITVNAAYALDHNSLTIPLAILRFPFTDHGIEAMNYGAIGSILSHEIIHGFDHMGKEFDAFGNIRSWWLPGTSKTFRTGAQCFIESYSRFMIKEVDTMVDGELTVNENIADNGGFSHALKAYKLYKTFHGDYVLPKFKNFSHEQLLMLSFASTYCYNPTINSLKMQLRDSHSPNPARVWGVIINSEEFGDIWNCKRGTPMNPDIPKCKIW